MPADERGFEMAPSMRPARKGPENLDKETEKERKKAVLQ